jgi:hypothetical protein
MNNPRMTLVGIESLLSHRQAAEDLGLSRTDIEKTVLRQRPRPARLSAEGGGKRSTLNA